MMLSLSLSLLLATASTSNALKLYGNSTIPTELTTGCAQALLADVSCDIAVTYLYPEGYFDAATLTKSCTDTCTQSLLTFENNIVTACGSQTFGGETNDDLTKNPIYPVAMLPNRFRFRHGLICMKDAGRWCNVVAGEAALGSSQSAGTLAFARVGSSNSSQSSNTTQIQKRAVSPCDLCFAKSLRHEAAAPYDNGPYLQSDSVYQSFTSSCTISNLPATTWTLPYTTTTSTPTPVPTCSGTSYTITSGDTCYSISQSKGIGTAWLLTDNNLPAACANFPTSGTLCLKNTCLVKVVLATDTCKTIAQASNISVQQLQAWNPILSNTCDNISRLNGTYLCVSNPGGPYVPPTATVVQPTEIVTPAPLPTQTGEGSLAYCGKWHLAVEGEYCNLLTMRYSISLPDFIFLNPSINENCTNLWADYSYCVEPVGDLNTYSGRPGYSTSLPAGPSLTWSNLPAATYITPTPVKTKAPLASGVRDDCARYFSGANFTTGVTNIVTPISACERVANAFGVSLFDLGSWNIGLNTSSSTCSFDPTKRYCGQWYSGDAPVEEDKPPTPLPIRDGTTKNCEDYAPVSFGWTCDNIITLYGITLAQFYRWNPSIGADCASLWLGYRYCVRSPDGEGSTTSRTSPTPTSTSLAAPSPTQDGQPTNCIAWHKAIEGDGCWKIYTDAGITPANFYAWNPAVGADCSLGVWLGYYYCIQTKTSSGTTTGVTSQPTTTRASTTTSRASTTASPTPVATPSPIQANNIISNCKKFDKAITGDYCAAMATRNGITLAQFGTWNTLMKTDGSGCAANFWLDYYYCVGV